MLVRIVKMNFRNEAIEDFKKFFETRKATIRSFEGCEHLQLWQDSTQANIFFTYSLWQNEDALLHYRNSSFFRDTWMQTKQLFADKAEAWSLYQSIVMEKCI